jgi:hypothetical protein
VAIPQLDPEVVGQIEIGLLGPLPFGTWLMVILTPSAMALFTRILSDPFARRNRAGWLALPRGFAGR